VAGSSTNLTCPRQGTRADLNTMGMVANQWPSPAAPTAQANEHGWHTTGELVADKI
jgi:hypothetical protein